MVRFADDDQGQRRVDFADIIVSIFSSVRHAHYNQIFLTKVRRFLNRLFFSISCHLSLSAIYYQNGLGLGLLMMWRTADVAMADLSVVLLAYLTLTQWVIIEQLTNKFDQTLDFFWQFLAKFRFHLQLGFDWFRFFSSVFLVDNFGKFPKKSQNVTLYNIEIWTKNIFYCVKKFLR